jgi:hypothetical protein
MAPTVIAGLLPATVAHPQPAIVPVEVFACERRDGHMGRETPSAIVPVEVFACERRDDLIKGARLLNDRNLEGIFIFYSSYFPHACTWIKANTEVHVEKSTSSGELKLECVRRDEKAPCWWTFGISKKL